jgi:tetratricopeptide (TPR) repeat protein
MVWKVAVDDLVGVTNSWTEWVDRGDTNRLAPGRVSERYYRVVLGRNSASATNTAPAETTEPTLPGVVSTGEVTNVQHSATNAISQSSALLPVQILQLLQTHGNLPSWNRSSSARKLADLQQCEILGELVAGGQATESSLSNALANSTLRVAMLEKLGLNLFLEGDFQHAGMFFEAIVQFHSKNATFKQLSVCYLKLARCYLRVANSHQDAALEIQYQQGRPDLAQPEFEAAITDYVKATTVSQDWVKDLGWLEAAACCRDLGKPLSEQGYLQMLLQQPTTSAMHRDLATYQLANSYYRQKRYGEAVQLYGQMRAQISNQVETYPGQKRYLGLVSTSLNWCAARKAEQAAKSTTKGVVQP